MGYVSDPNEAEELARLAQGSLDRAREIADPDIRKFRKRLFHELAQGDFWTPEFAKELADFVDAAGSEAPARRARLRQVVTFASDFYRNLIRSMTGCEPGDDSGLPDSVRSTAANKETGVESAVNCLDRCIDALWQIDANAHVPTLVDCWLSDLSDAAA